MAKKSKPIEILALLIVTLCKINSLKISRACVQEIIPLEFISYSSKTTITPVISSINSPCRSSYSNKWQLIIRILHLRQSKQRKILRLILILAVLTINPRPLIIWYYSIMIVVKLELWALIIQKYINIQLRSKPVTKITRTVSLRRFRQNSLKTTKVLKSWQRNSFYSNRIFSLRSV